jgi:hypothetical protein
MCDMGLTSASRGIARPELIVQGRDLNSFRAFADRTKDYWERVACQRCCGNDGQPRCRLHLMERIARADFVDLAGERRFIEHILKHVTAYARSFRWECRNTETDEDRAALISAVGWCSGWSAFIQVVR